MSARTSTSILGLALVGCTAAAVAVAGSASADTGIALSAPVASPAAPADITTADCSSGPTINTGSAGIDGSAAFFLSPASGFGANAGCTAVGAALAALWNALGSGSATTLSGTVSSNLNPGSAETAVGTVVTALGSLSGSLNPGSAATILQGLSSVGWTQISTGSVAGLVAAAGAGSVAAGNGVTGSAGLIPGSAIPVPAS